MVWAVTAVHACICLEGTAETTCGTQRRRVQQPVKDADLHLQWAATFEEVILKRPGMRANQKRKGCM